jgi:hypothetical protein
MAYHVILNGSGGELDRRTVQTEEEAGDAAIEMISEIAHLSHGDSISVIETD